MFVTLWCPCDVIVPSWIYIGTVRKSGIILYAILKCNQFHGISFKIISWKTNYVVAVDIIIVCQHLGPIIFYLCEYTEVWSRVILPISFRVTSPALRHTPSQLCGASEVNPKKIRLNRTDATRKLQIQRCCLVQWCRIPGLIWLAC